MVALGLGVLTLLTRLPGLVSGRMFNVDEAYLAAMGLTIGQGGRLYVDVLDRKPPVLPWIYALSEWAMGTVDLRLLRLLVVLSVAATGVVVVLLAARLGASRGASALAGALTVLGTAAFPPPDAQAANFELFALLPSALAVLAAVAARGRTTPSRLGLLLVAGVLVGVAGMIKQPFLVMLAPVGWEVLRAGLPPRLRHLGPGAGEASAPQHTDLPTGPVGARLGAVLAGGVVVLAGVAAASLAIAAPFGAGDVWRWAWVDTGDYLDGQVGGFRILAVLATVAAAFALLHLPSLAAVWIGRSRMRTVDPVVWFWLIGAAVAVVPGFRFLIHYFQLLVPPLAMVAGLALSTAGAGGLESARLRRAQAWVLGSAAFVTAGCVLVASLPSADLGRVGPDLVAAVQERTEPGDRIVVWGALPELLWRTERLAGQRFLSVGYVNGKWAGREDVPEHPEGIQPYRDRWDLFNADLREHHPALVIDMTTSGLDDWGPYSPQRYSFGDVLQRCYEPLGEVDGMALWELADPSCIDEVLAASPSG